MEVEVVAGDWVVGSW